MRHDASAAQLQAGIGGAYSHFFVVLLQLIPSYPEPQLPVVCNAGSQGCPSIGFATQVETLPFARQRPVLQRANDPFKGHTDPGVTKVRASHFLVTELQFSSYSHSLPVGQPPPTELERAHLPAEQYKFRPHRNHAASCC
jgi:hypothetical protein